MVSTSSFTSPIRRQSSSLFLGNVCECNGLVSNECPDERGLPYGRRGAREERERERERERNARMDVGAMATTRGGLLAAEWVSA